MIGRWLRSAKTAFGRWRGPSVADERPSRWDDPDFTHTLGQVNWMANNAVLGYLNERATGHPMLDWISGWGSHFCRGEGFDVLVLGCGEGWLERSIASHSTIRRIHAVDVAAEAVGRARESARDIEKITYGVVDLNRDTLPENEYDIVFAHSVLHHVGDLEHAFEQIRRTMRRDAILLVNEYVGPKHLQIPRDVVKLINRLLPAIPPRLRFGSIERRFYDEKQTPPLELMLRLDPTEAVRSDEILPVLRRQFDVLDEVSIGGTILQHLLYDIIQNFRFDDSHERALLELLCALEGELVDQRAIGCDFVLAAARKKESQTPRDAYDWSRHPTSWSDEKDRDPLEMEGYAPRRGRRAKHTPQLPRWVLRVLRIALISTREKRGLLITHDPDVEQREQERYAASTATPFEWVIGRYLGVVKSDDENARAIVTLLETMEAIALDKGILPR